MPTDPLLSRATAMKDELVAVRRDIHGHPELAFQEQRGGNDLCGLMRLLEEQRGIEVRVPRQTAT